MQLRWPTLSRRIRGQRIVDLRHEPSSGYLVLELEEGELWLSADWEGCQVLILNLNDSASPVPVSAVRTKDRA